MGTPTTLIVQETTSTIENQPKKGDLTIEEKATLEVTAVNGEPISTTTTKTSVDSTYSDGYESKYTNMGFVEKYQQITNATKDLVDSVDGTSVNLNTNSKIDSNYGKIALYGVGVFIFLKYIIKAF